MLTQVVRRKFAREKMPVAFFPAAKSLPERRSHKANFDQGVPQSISQSLTLTQVVRQKGLEPPTYCLEGSCSIRMSYRRVWSE